MPLDKEVILPIKFKLNSGANLMNVHYCTREGFIIGELPVYIHDLRSGTQTFIFHEMGQLLWRNMIYEASAHAPSAGYTIVRCH